MARRGWLAPVIEFYLPRDTDGQEVAAAARDSFRPLLRLVERSPVASFTVAFDPGLARALLRHGQAGILQDLAAAVERGQVELAAGALSHALLARLPRREVERQLRLGNERMRETMGRSWRPHGLFPPALGSNRLVAEIAADRGMRWILCDELALGRLGIAPRDRVAALRGRPDALLFFRDREVSDALVAGSLPAWEAGYRVAVLPARAFREGAPVAARLEKLIGGEGPRLTTLGHLTAAFPDRLQVEPLPCSWRTTPAELAAGLPFAAWSAPDNEIQAHLWHLVAIAMAEMERLEGSEDPAYTRARALLDEGLQTAPFRYASGRGWWDPERVKAAAARLLAALEAGAGALDAGAIAEARDVHARIGDVLAAWERHRVPDRLRRGVAAAAPATELAG